MRPLMQGCAAVILLALWLSCRSQEEINQLHQCQLECAEQLNADLDRCDADNVGEDESVINTCYREVIEAYRQCVATCEG